MRSHIVGRPGEATLDILLGHGDDPEQAFIGAGNPGRQEWAAKSRAKERQVAGVGLTAHAHRVDPRAAEPVPRPRRPDHLRGK